MAQFDVEKREHEMKMKKMEQEMEEVSPRSLSRRNSRN